MYARRTLLGTCGLSATYLLASSAGAYNHTGHQRISDLSWQVMVASTKPDLVQSNFTTQTPAALDSLPEGANADDWKAFLDELEAAVSRIPKAHSGLDQPKADPATCGGNDSSEYLYPQMNTGDCRSSELQLAPTTLWARDATCQARPRHNPGGIYTAVNAGFTGMQLGRLATSPDDQIHDTGMFFRPTDALGLGTVNNLVDKTTNFAVALLVAPVLCAVKLFKGESCWDGIEDGIDIGNDADLTQRLTGNIGLGEVHELFGRDLIGFWHFLQLEAPAGEFNDVPGLNYDFAGPGGTSEGVIDTAMALTGDLSGLSLKIEYSDGVRRYELTQDETKTPNPSIAREKYEWQGRTFNHIEMNPLDNLAQFGMDQFEQDPSTLKSLGYPLHALGDVTVPMHVVGTSSWGHGPFESTVDDLFPQILYQHETLEQETSEAERLDQLAQARRILLDGFRWWSWVRDYRDSNPEWGKLPIRPFLMAIAEETRKNGSELLIDDASFIDTMSIIGSKIAGIDPNVSKAYDRANQRANDSIAAYNERTGAALAPVTLSPVELPNVYHWLLPVVRERVEASAGAQVAFLTIVGSELVQPLDDSATTACAGIEPRCTAGQSAADGSCLAAADLCPDGQIPDPNAPDECIDQNPTCTPGQHLNQTTHTCEYCAIDATLAWSSVNCSQFTKLPLEATSSVDDNCPSEFWVKIENLQIPTEATAFNARVIEFGDETTCSQIAANVDVYGGKTDGTFESLGSASGFGEWNQVECITPAGVEVPRSDISGRTAVLVRSLLFTDPGGASLQLNAVANGNLCGENPLH
jgi:hypothetical protein